MDKLAKHGHQANKAALYGELCALLFAKSHYDEVCIIVFILIISELYSIMMVVFMCVFFFVSQAYRWCIEAMKEITTGLPVKVVVDVLRQASKVSFIPLRLWCLYRMSMPLQISTLLYVVRKSFKWDMME